MSARKPWFSDDPGQLELLTYLQRMHSWQKAVADGEISVAEVQAQAQRVIQLLKTVQPLLNTQQHAQLTRILYEMAVLQALQTLALTGSKTGGQDAT